MKLGIWIKSKCGDFQSEPIKVIAKSNFDEWLVAVPKSLGYGWDRIVYDPDVKECQRHELCSDKTIRLQFDSYVLRLYPNDWEILSEDYG